MKKQLWIYHPETGTVISLSDEVYLVDVDQLPGNIFEIMLEGGEVSPREHRGHRIDNYNMTNLFFGE